MNIPDFNEAISQRMKELGVPPEKLTPMERFSMFKKRHVLVTVDCEPGCGRWYYVAHPCTCMNELLDAKPEELS